MNHSIITYAKWLLVSVFLGSSFALVYSKWTPALRIPRGRSISAEYFQQRAFRQNGAEKHPSFRNVVIYPPTTTEHGERIQYVAGEMYIRRPRSPYSYERFTLWADIPFASSPSPAQTVTEFLDKAPVGGPRITYHYAWWASPAKITAIAGGSAILLIGTVMPSILLTAKHISRTRRIRQSAASAALATAPGPYSAEDSDPAPEGPSALPSLSSASDSTSEMPTALTGEPLGIVETEGGPLREYKGQYYPVEVPRSTSTAENRSVTLQPSAMTGGHCF